MEKTVKKNSKRKTYITHRNEPRKVKVTKVRNESPESFYRITIGDGFGALERDFCHPADALAYLCGVLSGEPALVESEF